MRSNAVYTYLVVYLLFGASVSINCQNELASQLKNALTFYASFDDGFDADLATGDKGIYSAPSHDQADAASQGNQIASVQLNDQGKFGGALAFGKKVKDVLYYQADGNVHYDEQGFSGTLSLWLSLDPEEDLEPGYCDPIQITDVSYNDAAFWVDFSDKNPRLFRMGVFGDLKIWNPENIGPDKNPVFNDRLVVAADRPFGSGVWTHVVIAYANISNEGKASFYVNGKFQGERKIDEPFTWEEPKAKVFLGLNYIGLIDELSIYNRMLSSEEIDFIYNSQKKLQDLILSD